MPTINTWIINLFEEPAAVCFTPYIVEFENRFIDFEQVNTSIPDEISSLSPKVTDTRVRRKMTKRLILQTYDLDKEATELRNLWNPLQQGVIVTNGKKKSRLSS